MDQVTLRVAGMTCNHCVGKVQKALEAVEGVTSAQVDLASGTAVVSGTAPSAALIAATGAVGKPSTVLEPSSVTLKVEGMTCNHCVGRVQKALEAVEGVTSAQVDLASGTAVVSGTAPSAALIAATGAVGKPSSVANSAFSNSKASLGYVRRSGDSTPSASRKLTSMRTASVYASAEAVEVQLSISGMTCASCVAAVERGLADLRGVVSVSVSLMGKSGTICYEPSILSPKDLIMTVQSSGYDASMPNDKIPGRGISESFTAEADEFLEQLIGAAMFSIPAFLLAMVCPWTPLGPMLDMPCPFMQAVRLRVVMLIILVTPVQFYYGAGFYRRAWAAAKHGNANMDVLVVLGTSTAYFYSLAFTLLCWQSHGEYGCDNECFETSAMLITFMLLGKYLEANAKSKASESISKLIKLQPPTALRCKSVGHEPEEVPVHLLATGDICKVLPGGKVPIDGVVIEGASTVNESMITGEAIPVIKSVGDHVVGGSVNGSGSFWVQVHAVGKDTVLAKIAKLVSDAQMRKPAVQAHADVVAGYFVPAVVMIAIATYFSWIVCIFTGLVPDSIIEMAGVADSGMLAFQFGSAVLVIACPCALGLATPTAVMVGSGIAASFGILFKGGDVLERASKVNTIFFDKTGTLTKGELQVTDVLPNGSGTTKEELLAMAASAEQDSEHPIGKAITSYARSMQAKLRQVTQFEATAGSGLRCWISGSVVLVGNRSWLQRNEVSLPEDMAALASKYERGGSTMIFVAAENRLIGMIALTDEPKPEARSVVRQLEDRGVQVWMISGDHEHTAQHMARRLGISNVYAGVKPQEKAEKVAELQAAGHSVAMVGDGVNDAPALAVSHVGIAVGSGTDVAIETADVVLMKNALTDVLTTIHMSGVVMNRIKLNFCWAVGYNIIGIPLAAGLFFPHYHVMVPPMFAGFAMAMSSVSVVCSSLLLRCYKPPTAFTRQDSSANQLLDMV